MPEQGCAHNYTIQLAAVGVGPKPETPSIIEFERARPHGMVGGTYSVSLRSVGPGEQYLEDYDRFHVHVHYM